MGSMGHGDLIQSMIIHGKLRRSRRGRQAGSRRYIWRGRMEGGGRRGGGGWGRMEEDEGWGG